MTAHNNRTHATFKPPAKGVVRQLTARGLAEWRGPPEGEFLAVTEAGKRALKG